jgi:lipopolysaccharide/colanic/teichoic acid biosynthesis glycosyltransferase
VGRDARIFPILKFRTTTVDLEQDGWAIAIDEDQQITHLGQMLRALHLDELPELWNVLRGDMSLVGPRPEIPSYVATYTRQQLRVLTVLPGLTDLASVRYRQAAQVLTLPADGEEFYRHVVLPEKLLSNLEYIERASLALDIKLVIETARSILRVRKAPQHRS